MSTWPCCTLLTAAGMACPANVMHLTVPLDTRGYTVCGILLVLSANGNGNELPLNGILFYRIPFNRILFPFVSVKPNLPASVNCWQR